MIQRKYTTNRENPYLMMGELYPYYSKNTTVPETFFLPARLETPLAPAGEGSGADGRFPRPGTTPGPGTDRGGNFQLNQTYG